ncbi:MAG: hypothetical protein IPN20_04595 [Haliscomenobacter sp.]|nr:hypothetical protein [Haliscomenobacter sp.]
MNKSIDLVKLQTQAEEEVARLRALGWTQADFARSLKDFLTTPTNFKERSNYIVGLARKEFSLNKDVISIDIGETQISEGSDNGAWVRAWVWVDFSDTPLDKES